MVVGGGCQQWPLLMVVGVDRSLAVVFVGGHQLLSLVVDCQWLSVVVVVSGGCCLAVVFLGGSC